MIPYRFTLLIVRKQAVALFIIVLTFIGCDKHSPQQEVAVERPPASQQSPPKLPAMNTSPGPAAPAEEGDGPEYQEAAEFVSMAMREQHVRTLHDLEDYAKQTHLRPAAEKAIVRVLESMESVVGPEKVKPPVKGKYVAGLSMNLLNLSLATQMHAKNDADALARQLQDRLDAGLVAGQTSPLYLKADALRDLAHRRGIYDVDGILAMPEAKDLSKAERDAIRSILTSG